MKIEPLDVPVIQRVTVQQDEKENYQVSQRQENLTSQSNTRIILNSDETNNDSEAAPLKTSNRQSYLHTLSHTPPKEQIPPNDLDNTEPPNKRRRAPQTTPPETKNDFQDRTQCHTTQTTKFMAL